MGMNFINKKGDGKPGAASYTQGRTYFAMDLPLADDFFGSCNRKNGKSFGHRVYIWLWILLCTFILLADTQTQALAAKNVNHSAEYASFGITAKGSAYYYKGSRVRIFHDMKADGSFEYSFVDRKGTADIRLLRGKNGAVNSLEIISKAEANEILKDLFGYVPSGSVSAGKKEGKDKAAGKAKKAAPKAGKRGEYTDILRCGREDLPSGLQAILENKCTGNRWYVIKAAGRQYVYFNNLPGDYAFHISGKKLYVRDMGRYTGICVLLSLGKDADFSLYYNGRKVKLTSIDA